MRTFGYFEVAPAIFVLARIVATQGHFLFDFAADIGQQTQFDQYLKTVTNAHDMLARC